jgi:hypothetical protein
MPLEWQRISRETIEADIVNALKNTHDNFAEILRLTAENGMPNVFMTWAEEHSANLRAMAGVAMQVMGQMPDQIDCFKKDIPCLIERTQIKNAKAKKNREAKKKSAPAVKKKAAKKVNLRLLPPR